MNTEIKKNSNKTPDYLPPMLSQFNAAAPMPIPKPKSDLDQIKDDLVKSVSNPVASFLCAALGVTNSATGMPWNQSNVDVVMGAAGFRTEQPKRLTDYMPYEMPVQFVEWDASIDAALNNKPTGPKTPGM